MPRDQPVVAGDQLERHAEPGQRGDDGYAPACEIEWNLAALLNPEQVRLVRVEDGVIQRIAQSGLELRVARRQLQNRWRRHAEGVEGVLNADYAFGERAGLVRA